MRCPDCNKFVSFDTETDPEFDVSVDDEGNVSGTVRIVNNCQECGQELKEATLDVEASVTEDVEKHRAAKKEEGDEASAHDSLDVEADGSRTERTQTKDRHGRPIKSARYMRRYYGAEATLTVTCKCGETFEAKWEDDVAASAMEEMV